MNYTKIDYKRKVDYNKVDYNKLIYVFIIGLYLFSFMNISYAMTDKSLTIIKNKGQVFYRNSTFLNEWNFQLLFSEIYNPSTSFVIYPMAVPPFSSNVSGTIECNGVDVLNINYNPNETYNYQIKDFMLNQSLTISNSSLNSKNYEWTCYFNPTGDYDWGFDYQIVAFEPFIDVGNLNQTFLDKITNSYVLTFNAFNQLFGYITDFIALIYLMFEFFVLTFVVFGLIPFIFYIGVKHIRKLKNYHSE